MLAIYKKEIRTYLHTVIGWLFMAVILFFISLYFVAYNLFSGDAVFADAINASGFILLLAVPILTMKILAEERKQRTDQLILTAPVSVGKIVLAKFFSLGTIMAIPMVLVCFYPLIMGMFGKVAYAQAYLAILGYFLYGLTCVSVGIFISSITENQVIAAVLSFITLFLTYMMAGLCSLISTDGNVLTTILGAFDFYSRFADFLSGTLSVTGIVYFLSVCAFMLFLTTQSILKRRFTVSTRSLKNGVFSSSMILIATALVIMVNLAADQLPDGVKSLDVTSNKLYSITEDTQKVLENLDQDVTIYVLSSENGADETIAKMLSRYEAKSSHIKVEYKDPVKYPQFAASYTSDSITKGSLIIESNKRSKVVDYTNMYDTSVDYTTYSTTVNGYDGEGQVTSAINYVLSDDMPKIYAITGHDEISLETSFTSAVEKANITMDTLNLMNCETIPEDAEAIMLLAPTSDYSTDDVSKVKAYLEAGGKAFVLATYTEQELPNFYSIMSDYGINLMNAIVCDNDTDHYYQNPFYLLPKIEESDETADIDGNRLIFMPYAIAMTLDESKEGLTFDKFLSTSEQSVAKSDVNNSTSYTLEDGDIAGPFYLGAKVTKEENGTESQLVIFTSENIFTENADQYVSGTNLTLFGNALKGIVTSDVEGVAIPMKSYDMSSITVTQTDLIFISLSLVIVIPIGLLIAGIVIWAKRRRK